MTKPGMPRVMRILGQRHAVERYAHITDEDGKALLGDIDHEQQVIRISTHQSADSLADTFIHEALHGLYKLAGLSTDNEDEVNRLAPILLLWLRDNPNAVNYLTGRWSYRAK